MHASRADTQLSASNALAKYVASSIELFWFTFINTMQQCTICGLLHTWYRVYSVWKMHQTSYMFRFLYSKAVCGHSWLICMFSLALIFLSFLFLPRMALASQSLLLSRPRNNSITRTHKGFFWCDPAGDETPDQLSWGRHDVTRLNVTHQPILTG